MHYDATNRTATLTPNSALVPSSTYTAQVIGGAGGVADVGGQCDERGCRCGRSRRPRRPPTTGPGGPILVIGSSANPFGRYYGEILRAEGLNEYRGTDIANVTPAVLSAYHVVDPRRDDVDRGAGDDAEQLGERRRQARRDASRRPARRPARLDEGARARCRTRTCTSTRARHRGRASPTRRSSTTAPPTSTSCRARRASRRSTATRRPPPVYPAVTLARRRDRAAARRPRSPTTSPARSSTPARAIPAWAGQERDGQPPIRSDDLFFGASASDPQPDWVDLDKVAIPQADEQQRLLANLVLQMESTSMPLPRFWYLPRGDKAVVVMTGDDHGNGGTAGRFDEQIGDSPAGCNVANWECVRSTSYVYPSTPLTDAQAAGVHATRASRSGCTSRPTAPTGRRSRSRTSTAASSRRGTPKYPSLPGPVSSRTHCIVEQRLLDPAPRRAGQRHPARHQLLLLAADMDAGPARACSPARGCRCGSPIPTAP